MLFVWLLVVGMGMANACLATEDHAGHGHLQHHDDPLPELVTTGVNPDSQAQPASPEKAACQKFCTAAQSSVSKQQSHDPALMDAGLMLATGWQAAPAPDRPSVSAGPQDRAWTEPSIAIRFLRLTL